MNHPRLLQIQEALDNSKLWKAAHLCRQLADDLTPPTQATNDVLRVVKENPGSNRAAIITKSGWCKNSVDRALGMLLRQGLVTSKPQPVPRSDSRLRTVPTYHATSTCL